jgi:hypothetical protein
VCSAVAYFVQGIVMKQRGPVFVTAFNPLCMIITALLGTFILGEQITLGRSVKSKFPDSLIYLIQQACFDDANTVFLSLLLLFSICSVLGAIIIVTGLYALIWGQGKDHLDNKLSDSGATELPLSTFHDCKHDSCDHTKNGHDATITSIRTNP